MNKRYDKVVDHIKLALILAASAEGVTLSELEAQTGKSRRTIQRMKSALSEIFRIEENTDERQTRFRITQGLGRFFNAPTSEELAELKTAIKSVSKIGHHGRAELLESLSNKILSALRTQQRNRLAPDIELLNASQLPITFAGPSIAYDHEVLKMLKLAILSGNRVSFSYTTHKENKNTRTVDPHGFMLGRVSYLVAYHTNWDNPANYRLDRISNIEILPQTMQIREEFDLDTYAMQSFGVFQEPPYNIQLKFSEKIAQEVLKYRFHASQSITQLDDGSVLVTLKTGGLTELSWHLFTWGEHVKIIEPLALKQRMKNLLDASLHAIN